MQRRPSKHADKMQLMKQFLISGSEACTCCPLLTSSSLSFSSISLPPVRLSLYFLLCLLLIILPRFFSSLLPPVSHWEVESLLCCNWYRALFFYCKKTKATNVIIVGQVIVMLLAAFKGETVLIPDQNQVAACGNALYMFASKCLHYQTQQMTTTCPTHDNVR